MQTAPATDTDALLAAFAERVAQMEGKPEQVQQIANSLRWEPRLDRTPPAVVIMRKGAKVAGVSNLVATISNTGAFADMYPSWVPVLAERAKVANGRKRVQHKGLPVGRIPDKKGQ